MKDTITIIIPCKNEEKSIREIIAKCQRHSDDIMIVDGHSKDKTREIAESMNAKVCLDNGKGKGDGVRVGIAKAPGEIIVFIDADCSHDPDEIPNLVQPIIEGKADLVIGSRGRGGSDELHGDLPKFIRMMGGDIITLGLNYRFGVRLTDTQNGFRAIKKDVAQSLNLKENITTIEQEMVIKTLKRGYKVSEVPSHEYARKYGDSTIKVNRVFFRYVYSWLKYLFLG
jgi:dolichol-phosphate mannosyltransferase